jgi:regulator of replication initiation timing
MAAEAEVVVSCSPQTALSDQIHSQIRALVESILANTSAQYEDNLTKQVGLLHAENQELRDENQRLRQAANTRIESRRAVME